VYFELILFLFWGKVKKKGVFVLGGGGGGGNIATFSVFYVVYPPSLSIPM